ncbi:Fur family transcriptional regulator [Telluribacter sp.]|jgi:Fur family ferric uptake transcriptional regulator|uniref:Fur family transcriptional regulator n=1 Tax=Telluribacter sp. TaxID=1978767 RepID=UPI002E14A069|nr:transcriptional repressor [Telluribacter sp.]
MESFVKDTLKDHNLRSTSCREDILDTFLSKEVALSHGDIENYLGERFDRVTIYRTLKTFLEKGIIHKVLDDEGVRYALCKDHCSEHDHHHDHIHFKCIQCGQTNCLANVHIPAVQLPDGYRANELNLLIQGRCPACN